MHLKTVTEFLRKRRISFFLIPTVLGVNELFKQTHVYPKN